MNIPLPFLNFLGLLKYGVISQALYFLTIPIILKKYDAENYGIFTIVFSVSAVLGVISALKIERAIVVESTNKIRSILTHCFTNMVFLSFICSFIIFFILKPFDINQSEKLVLTCIGGLYCFLFGLAQVLIHIAIRQEKVKLTGIADLIYSALLVVFLLGFKPSSISEELWLLILFTTARLLSLFSFLPLGLFSYFAKGSHEKVTFKYLSKYYFPVITVLLSNIQFKGIFYLTGVYYGGAITGSLSMAQRIVYAPVNLIGASLRKAFFKEFTRSKEDFQQVNGYINKILTWGSIISLLVFPVFILVIQKAPIYIPDGWGQLPSFGLALYPVASILLLLSWLDRIYDAKKKQPLALFYEAIFTVVLYTALFTALFFEVKSLNLLLIFTTVSVIYNLIWAFLTLKLIKSNLTSMLYLTILHLAMLIITIFYLSGV